VVRGQSFVIGAIAPHPIVAAEVRRRTRIIHEFRCFIRLVTSTLRSKSPALRDQSKGEIFSQQHAFRSGAMEDGSADTRRDFPTPAFKSCSVRFEPVFARAHFDFDRHIQRDGPFHFLFDERENFLFLGRAQVE